MWEKTGGGSEETVQAAWGGAEAEFEAALALNPQHPTAASNLVAMLVNQQRLSEAIAIGQRSVDAKGASWVLHKTIGVAYRAMQVGGFQWFA